MKQDPFSGVYRALTPKELAEMFMNPHAPKTEAEHWAVREIEKLTRERDEARAEVERLRDEDTKTRHALRGWVWVCPDGGDEPTHERVSAVVAEVERLTRERDEARAEIERLRAALVLASEVLASHRGSPGREWHSAGAWLYPGDSINVVRAPLPEMEAKP